MHTKQIHLTNTLGRKKEVLVPLHTDEVHMYHCGPTVYWTQHIGNMRAVVLADIIRRTCAYAGYKVIFIRNYTDVGHLTGDNVGDADSGEDRMEKAAKREQLDPLQIASKYIEQFEHDSLQLNILPPTKTPRATEHIQDMIEMISTLLASGHAYTTDHAIYFDITTYEAYTKLSGQSLDMQKEGTGHGSVHDAQKKNASDFALWFFKAGTHEHALQTWPSPFTSPLVQHGEGFPGWHIECSAMSRKYLGPTFDIHIGGVEHISIHHTNEIAQSVCANNAPFATYWLHNEHLLVDNKKMSKSDGTSYVLGDITDKGFNPLSLRYFFLQANYRSKQNFTFESLQASETAYVKLRKLVSELPDGGTPLPTYVETFDSYLLDDFNVTGALSVVWDLVKNGEVEPADIKATILLFDTVLGLQLDVLPAEKEIPSDIQELLAERKTARTHKDWVTSDKIRDILSSKGYTVHDVGDDQTVSLI